ncbi:MAG: FKBP-type peptidyl-prolyl cis-trans isomerase [Gammaproteobacteria bacterium]|nr:FKBP-type peptidyl-prolyl cis-trans isomerase [Gammaproteobacteria bacterium]
MKNLLLLFVFTCILLLNPTQADDLDDKQKLGYALGVFFAENVAQQGIDMDTESFIAAVADVLHNRPRQLSPAEIQDAFMAFQQREQQNRAAQATVNRQAGEEFLASNKDKEGIVALDNGLQYRIVRPGTGPKPQAGGEVSVHYRGTLLDGREFDSSYQRGEPTRLSLNRVIRGWQLALPMMQTGAKWQLYIPAELAYGGAGQGAIGPDETLIFEVELVAVH